MNRPGYLQNERGVSAVELALMLPFLVVLMVVVVDLGLLLREHQILNNAAREGARISSLPKYWIAPQNPGDHLTTIKQRVIEYCAQESIPVTAAQIAVNQGWQVPVGAQVLLGSRVTVTVNRPLMFLDFFVGNDTIQLQGESIFVNLY